MTNFDWLEGFVWGAWGASAALLIGQLIGIPQISIVLSIAIVNSFIFYLCARENND